jgi:hypothetical protein
LRLRSEKKGSMTEKNLDERIGRGWDDAISRAAEHPLAIAGLAFALGVVTGLCVKGAATWTRDAVRRGQWHRDYERTVTYDENLPDSLQRREPPPHPDQVRYGGTGALGVSPASANTPWSPKDGAADTGPGNER